MPGPHGREGVATIPRPSGRLAAIQRDVLDVAAALRYEGFSKHDALNAPWLERLAGESRVGRLVAIQAVMRCPIHVRPLLGVRTARNAKGMALFARALLARVRLLDEARSAEEAGAILDWLLHNSAPGFPSPCWGYPYPWQDVGFFAPRHYPNRVVTSFVVQALLDGYETLGRAGDLEAARRSVEFLLDAPRTLYQDATHRAVSYVPSEAVSWNVLDISALTGAAAARVAALCNDATMMREAGRLVRYVVSKQTPYGAWYYTEPPSASRITHDNYHTGFILDSVLEYSRLAESAEFEDAYRRGLRFYRERLFDPDGAPRFRYDRRYPFDIHGAAQGTITFALASSRMGDAAQADMSRRILDWAVRRMYDTRSHWFDYQHGRVLRTRIRELRWCQAWMAWAIGCHLEHCGDEP